MIRRKNSAFSIRIMGVNGQKRKKKQGPVPSLEESLPKKFKAGPATKPKKQDSSKTGAKVNGKEKRESKANKTDAESVNEFETEAEDFGVTKALLFDGEDQEEEPISDFGSGADEPMYLCTHHSPLLIAGTMNSTRTTRKAEKMSSVTRKTKKN
jgi:hypothetical protein